MLFVCVCLLTGYVIVCVGVYGLKVWFVENIFDCLDLSIVRLWAYVFCDFYLCFRLVVA